MEVAAGDAFLSLCHAAVPAGAFVEEEGRRKGGRGKERAGKAA